MIVSHIAPKGQTLLTKQRPFLLPALAENPRESMKRDLPSWIQPFLTNLTSKPFLGETSRRSSAISNVVQPLIYLVFGMTSGSMIVSHGGLLLTFLPLVWGIILHATRKLRLTIMHACSHYAVFKKSRRLNNYLGEFISILTCTKEFKSYQRDHTKTHHSQKLMTPGDETYNYLIEVVGFRLGMTKDKAWNHLFRTMVNPRFHVCQCLLRVKWTFGSKSWKHNLLSLFFWGIIVSIVAFTHTWITFLLVWIIPMTLLFEISSLLRQCVEHSFPTEGSCYQSQKTLNQMTAAIFCGEKTPIACGSKLSLKKIIAWTNWWFRILFYHSLSRLLVLTGDSPCHDWHHRHPGNPDWSNCIFNRQQEVESGEVYHETWGLLEAIDKTFESLSSSNPQK